MPVPGFVLDLKFGSEFGAVLRGGQRVMPRRALDLGYEFRHRPRRGARRPALARGAHSQLVADGFAQASSRVDPAASDRVEQTVAIAVGSGAGRDHGDLGFFEDRRE